MKARAILHPAWKEAVAEFIRSGFRPGDVISHDWLFDNFQLERPKHLTYLDGKTVELEKLASFQRFKQELLEEHLVALRAVRGVGYQIVPPEDQTRLFYREGVRKIARTLQKTADYMTFVDTHKLTAAELKENSDAQARVSNMAAMFSRSRRLPRF